MTLVLHASPLSSSTPVQHALAELDVPHELVLYDLSDSRHRTPEFLAKNPNGRVPTLEVDGAPMFEALAILQWLGDRYGVERGLWPAADTPERLLALSWTTWTYVTLGSAFQRFNFAGSDRVPAELHHPPMREHAREELDGLLRLVDERLATRPYLLGDAFSLVDLVVAGAIAYFAQCGVSTDGHSHVKAWLDRFFARPSFQRVWAAA
jgi:glutathione S-transferase